MLTGFYYANSVRYGRHFSQAAKILLPGKRNRLYIDWERDTALSRTPPPQTSLYVALNLPIDRGLTLSMQGESSFDRRPWNDGYRIRSSETYVRTALEYLRPYWPRVEALELADEPPWSAAQARQQARMVNEEVKRAGLDPRPLAIVYTRSQILSSRVWDVDEVAIKGLEFYLDPKPHETVQQAQARMRAMATSLTKRVGRARVFAVGMAYDRNGWWTNMQTLKAVQLPIFQAARALEAQGRLLGLGLFSFARPGGVLSHPFLGEEHHRLIRS